MSDTIEAPWTPEQVANLRAWQACRWVHPFTCGPCRDKLGTRGPGWFNDRVLTPTVDGWVCVTCAYTQNWAHDFMLNQGPPPNPLERNTNDDD